MQEQEITELRNARDASVTDQQFYSRVGDYLFGETIDLNSIPKLTISVAAGNVAFPIRSFSEEEQFLECFDDIVRNPDIPWREVRERAY